MNTLHVLLVSIGTVALTEIGDKTQLLALLVAARFRLPGRNPGGHGVAGDQIRTAAAGHRGHHARHAGRLPPVVWMGHKFPDRLPLKLASNIAVAVFLALAVWVAWHGIG